MINFKKLYFKAEEGDIFYGRSIIAYQKIPWATQSGYGTGDKVIMYKCRLSIDLWILTIDLRWIKRIES